MTSNSDINLGFLNKESDKINVLEVVPDLNYHFDFDSRYLVSIMEILRYVQPENCILCRIKYIMENSNIASLQLLFSEKYLQFISDSELIKTYVTDTHYLLSGTLKQSISTLSPSFIHTLKEDKMTGVCCISVELLRQKIRTWKDEKGTLSRVLTTDIVHGRVAKELPFKHLSDGRLVSRDAKKIIDLNRPMIIFEQSELPKEFDYTPKSFETLCEKFSRQPKDCALHIIYEIDFSVEDQKVIIKNVDSNEKVIETKLDHTILTESDIKLSLEISCNNTDDITFNEITLNEIEIEQIFDSLCSIIRDLRMKIYSLVIDFGSISIERKNYDKFDQVLRHIPNLEILGLFDGYIRWEPFLECIESIKTLKELELTDIILMTNLSDRTAEDPDPEEFDYTIFKDKFCTCLKHLQSIRIAGDDCIVTKDEDDDDEHRLHLFDVLVDDCLISFTNLKSLGFTYNKKRISNFIYKLKGINTRNITRLDLSGSDLTKSIDKMVDIGLLVMKFSNLKELDLSACELFMINNLTDKSLGEYLSLGGPISMIDLLKSRNVTYMISDEEWYDGETLLYKIPEVVFEQSELPRDFLYSDKNFKDLCVQEYGKIKNYGLNVIFGIKFILVKGKRILEFIEVKDKRILDIKAFDTEGNELERVISRFVLTQPHIKLSIKIFCDNYENTNEDNMVIMNLISNIIKNLRTNIYSLVIDFKGINIERQDYDEFDKILRDIPNLTILKLSN